MSEEASTLYQYFRHLQHNERQTLLARLNYLIASGEEDDEYKFLILDLLQDVQSEVIFLDRLTKMERPIDENISEPLDTEGLCFQLNVLIEQN